MKMPFPGVPAECQTRGRIVSRPEQSGRDQFDVPVLVGLLRRFIRGLNSEERRGRETRRAADQSRQSSHVRGVREFQPHAVRTSQTAVRVPDVYRNVVRGERHERGRA